MTISHIFVKHPFSISVTNRQLKTLFNDHSIHLDSYIMAKANIIFPIFIVFLLTVPLSVIGQEAKTVDSQITITLDEALQIAMVNNYLLRKGLLDIETADEQIKEAWGSVYPQVNASGSYTRNIKSPNPFAGSDAGGLFQSFGAIDWLAFNERTRTDGNPDTNPITFDEYLERQEQGYEDAGISLPDLSDNPFEIENQFEFGISVTQAIYNGAAFAAIRGAQQLRDMNQDQVARDRQTVADEVRSAFYSALLAQEQTEVLRSSVDRLSKTVEDTRSAVRAGVLSKYDRMSAEVELVNLETNLIEAENQTALAVKALSLQLGIPVQTNVKLRGELEFNDDMAPELLNTEEAWQLALRQRPDVSQLDNYIELLRVNRNITRSGYFPVVNLFANAAYIGQVPDDRQVVSQVQGQDFTYRASSRGFFNDSYWNSAMSVGVRLNWNLFNGFQTRAQVQQQSIEIKQAQIDKEFSENAIYLEVDRAVRSLETAYRRIMSQKRNIESAQTNYEFALTRLREGVGTPLEERQASSLLDQSRLNYLSAVYDYLTALSQYETAIGKPVLPVTQQ